MKFSCLQKSPDKKVAIFVSWNFGWWLLSKPHSVLLRLYTYNLVGFWMPWADSLSISNSRLASQLQPCQMFTSPIWNIFYFIRGIPAYVSRLYASDFLIKFLVFYRTWHLPCQHSANIFLALSRLSQVWKQQASLILFQWVCSLFITTCKHNVRIFCIWKQSLQ